jgi:uncharacterized membrane protein
MTPAPSLRRVIGKTVAPPRFIAFALLLPIGYFGLQAMFSHMRPADTASMAFDFASAVFLLSLLPLVMQSEPEAIRQHADATDANRVLILFMTSLLMVTVMAAIAGELPGAKHGDEWAIVRLVGTLLMIWLFANTVYALHYAHEFYSKHPDSGGDAAGLNFPDCKEPAYGDFLYFSFTLGMTFQTSDVEIAARRIRNVALFHSFVAFVFNLGVIAFTINALGGGAG